MSDFSPEELELGRLLFAREVSFVIGAAALKQLPDGDRAEICFAGRSNVGKSSLINALTGRTNIARASNTPGRTQQLNYFSLEHPETGPLYMVDLPGYGFAKAPKAQVAQWQALLKAYLQGRASLRRVYLLIDSRHGPKPVDIEIMDMLDVAAVSYQCVLTKADKPRGTEAEAAAEALSREIAKRPAAFPYILRTSSEKGMGIEDLRAAIVRRMHDG